MIIIADAKGNVKPYFYLFLIFRAAAAAAALLRGGIQRRQLACQLLQRNAVDILVDHLVQPRPERQSEALLGHGALVGHAAKARNGCHAALDGAQDLAGGVVGSILSQAVAALTAPLALDQPYPRQRGNDLLQIFQAQVLPLADLLQADGGTRRIARQLRHQAQGVAALGGKFLPGNIKPVLEPAYAPPYYRNPLLAQAMVNFKMIDTASMGIRRVYSIQKEKLFPMPDYDLSRYQQVRVTVYGKILNDNYTKILFENPDMDLDTVYLLDRVQKGESISRLEAATLRKLGLVEGKIPKLFVSATVAEALDQKAQYIKNKGFDDQYYKQLIVDYLNKWGKGRKNDFEKLRFV